MFCYQCEQTERTPAEGLDGRTGLPMLAGCATARGNCGKDETTADLQDLLLYVVEGIGQYATRARAAGVPDDAATEWAMFAVFTTLTNVNFTATRFVAMIAEAAQIRDRVRAAYEAACAAAGDAAETPEGPATILPAADMDGLLLQAAEIGITAGRAEVGDDVIGLRALNLYGLKGVCAYAHHAAALGKTDPAILASVEQALDFLASAPTQVPDLLANALTLGTVNLSVMELLDAANTGSFGSPVPTAVRRTPKAGKAILVSGHDLHDLNAVLSATEGLGINVYTHGELLPAHGYPQLRRYSHLAGNYGGAWQDQQAEFAAFPGPIVMTSNCLIEPLPSYKGRIFTAGPVGWPGVRHLGEHIAVGDVAPVVRAALALPGFAEDGAGETITVGFARDAVLGVADVVIDAVKAGAIKHFFLIGGCDGAAPGRNYFTDVAALAPEDTVLLTLGCGKYRINDREYGEIGGIPRLLDVGQCNDTYSAIKIASALADAFGCGVNDLPLTLHISWFEQKAVAVLLTLLALGIRKIHLGPTLPAFLTPAVIDVLVNEFGVQAGADAEFDVKAAISA
jgi:hydroxylamine reductase